MLGFGWSFWQKQKQQKPLPGTCDGAVTCFKKGRGTQYRVSRSVKALTVKDLNVSDCVIVIMPSILFVLLRVHDASTQFPQKEPTIRALIISYTILLAPYNAPQNPI